MKDFEIVPYKEVDGIKTFSNSQIRKLYDMVFENGHGVIFDTSNMRSADDFLREMNTRSHLYIIYCEGKPISFMWINNIYERLAYGNWCTFKGFSYDQKITAGKESLKYLMALELNDEPMFDCLVGHTASKLKTAIAYMENCGMVCVGEVPKLMWNHRTNKSESGSILYYVRESDDEDIQRA